MIPLFLQMGDSDTPKLSFDSSSSEGSSWKADTMDCGYESDETNSEVTFANPMDSDNMTSLMRQKDMDVVSDAESVIGDLLMTEAYDNTVDDVIEFQRKIFFGGI